MKKYSPKFHCGIKLSLNSHHQNVMTLRRAHATQPEMDQRDPMTPRMLDEPGNAADQTGNAQPQDNADQHSHMQEEIYINRGRGLRHRYPLLSVPDTIVFLPGRREWHCT